MQWTITGHVHAEDVDWKTAASVKISDASIQSVKCSLAELTDTVWLIRHRKDQRNRLKVSSSKSWKRKSDLEHLSHTEDHLLFLQGLRSLNTAATTKDWKKSQISSSCEWTVRRAVAQLGETLSREMKKLWANAELERVQLYTLDVTLDCDTANPCQILSDDGKNVNCSFVENLSEKSPYAALLALHWSLFPYPSFHTWFLLLLASSAIFSSLPITSPLPFLSPPPSLHRSTRVLMHSSGAKQERDRVGDWYQMFCCYLRRTGRTVLLHQPSSTSLAEEMTLGTPGHWIQTTVNRVGPHFQRLSRCSLVKFKDSPCYSWYS